jgi:hydroxyacylglutathione hydrolase
MGLDGGRLRDCMRLEDDIGDILAKAMVGLGLGIDTVAAKVSEQAVEEFQSGTLSRRSIKELAGFLGLDADSLQRIADGAYVPVVAVPRGLSVFTTPYPVPGYEEMTVNAYLYFDDTSREAIIVDTGAGATGLLAVIGEKALRVRGLYLTHAHADHVAALATVRRALGDVPIWIDAREQASVPQALAIDERLVHTFDGFAVENRLTPGHSPGGRTYFISRSGPSIAFVGDALFAGSMGRARGQLPMAKAALQEHVMSLPDDTVLCPGHGPMTTVEQERVNNPFLAAG